MFSFSQNKFKYNTNNCWFASALIMEANNKTKKPITLEYALDVEQKAYDKFVMPKNWLTIKGGLDRVWELTKSETRLITFWSKVFNTYLDNGYLINVSITITDTFMNKRKSWQYLKDCEWKVVWSHVICICKRAWKYYFVNSWYWDDRDVREFAWFDIGIFKEWQRCGILF